MSFQVIIPSRNPDNLVSCVSSILRNEPDLAPERLLVMDDGARAGAESKLPAVTWLDGVKPFIFARNVNLGLRYAESDVILMNDDATLEKKYGFAELHSEGKAYGLASPSIIGAVGNKNQKHDPHGAMVRKEKHLLCFVCVLIPLATQQQIGLLDERFTSYGWEDNDYCRRVNEAGLEMAVLECCQVRHGVLPSTFRNGKSHHELTMMGDGGMKIYKQKWGSAQ